MLNQVTSQVDAISTSGTITVVTEQQVQAVPLTTTIDPLVGNLTIQTTPTFTFSASSTFSPLPTNVDAVYFQVDTWQGPWSAASIFGAGFQGTVSTPLSYGVHILYAYATDGQDGTSIVSGSLSQLGQSAIIGNITAYLFLVKPPPAPAFTSGTAVTFQVGHAGSYTVATTRLPTPSISESGFLPGGVTFTDNGDGTATLAGTPTRQGGIHHRVPGAKHREPGCIPILLADDKSTSPRSPAGTRSPSMPGTVGSFARTTVGYPVPAISEAGSLPSGVTFQDNGNGTATLSGTPTASGVYHLIITAQNRISFNATQVLTLTVVVSILPVRTRPRSRWAWRGRSPMTASGNPNPTFLESGSLPGGVTFHDNGNGTAMLSGTPTASGTFVLSSDRAERGESGRDANFHADGNFEQSSPGNHQRQLGHIPDRHVRVRLS